VKAYVLITAHVGDINAAVSILRRTTGVISAYPTLGPYDIIALVEGDDLQALGDLIIRQIHAINEIVETTSCIVLNG
jgi:DNA-binding Lrp family transcriptional regulator